MSLEASRGVALEDTTGKLYSRVLRFAARPYLAQVAAHLQSGALPGGGVELPALAVRLFFDRGRAMGLSCGMLFTDVTSAFYSILPEVWLGELLASEARCAALCHVGFTSDDIRLFEERYVEGPSWAQKAGMPPDLVRAPRTGTRACPSR